MTQYACRRCGMTDDVQLERCHDCDADFPFKPVPEYGSAQGIEPIVYHPGSANAAVRPSDGLYAAPHTPAAVSPRPVLFRASGEPVWRLPVAFELYLVPLMETPPGSGVHRPVNGGVVAVYDGPTGAYLRHDPRTPALDAIRWTDTPA